MFDLARQAGQPTLTIRSYVSDDAIPLGRIYFRAVREGATAYSAEQRAAWAPHAPASAVWRRRLSHGETVVAEQNGDRIGFLTLLPDTGVVDLAFVLPEVMGQGVAASLYAVLEGRARASGLNRLTTEASEVAKPFFERQGFQTLARQDLARDGVPLHNYRMEKRLTPETPA